MRREKRGVKKNKMAMPNRFPQRPRQRKEEDRGDCKIEIKKTRTGKKVLIGKNCSASQLKMLEERGVRLGEEDN